jgi:AcrR family transcriptional regulator
MANPASRPPTAPKARSARGERTLRAIHRAAAAIIGEQGSTAASQEQIARRAGISQSTLRHHYPTKEALVEAIYDALFEGPRQAFERLLLEPGGTPAERLLQLAETHLDHIARTDDAYIFESFAHLARSEASRKKRDAWYAWLSEHYVALLRQIRPGLTSEQAHQIAFQILTLLLGGWVTLGRSRPRLLGRGAAEAREALLAGLESLVGVPLRSV